MAWLRGAQAQAITALARLLPTEAHARAAAPVYSPRMARFTSLIAAARGVAPRLRLSTGLSQAAAHGRRHSRVARGSRPRISHGACYDLHGCGAVWFVYVALRLRLSPCLSRAAVHCDPREGGARLMT